MYRYYRLRKKSYKSGVDTPLLTVGICWLVQCNLTKIYANASRGRRIIWFQSLVSGKIYLNYILNKQRIIQCCRYLVAQ